MTLSLCERAIVSYCGSWSAGLRPSLVGVESEIDAIKDCTPISYTSSRELENESINIDATVPAVGVFRSRQQGNVEERISCGEFEEKKWHIINGKKVKREIKMQGYLICYRGQPKFTRKEPLSRRSAVSKKSIGCKYRAYAVVYKDEPNVFYRKILHTHTGHVVGSAEDNKYMKPDEEAIAFVKEVRLGLGRMVLGTIIMVIIMSPSTKRKKKSCIHVFLFFFAACL